MAGEFWAKVKNKTLELNTKEHSFTLPMIKSVKDFLNDMQKCETFFFPWVALLVVDVKEERNWIHDLWALGPKIQRRKLEIERKGGGCLGLGQTDQGWPSVDIRRGCSKHSSQRAALWSKALMMSSTLTWKGCGVPLTTLILLPKVWRNTHLNYDDEWEFLQPRVPYQP